jgi:predicted GH43/DUF377 family glycosyl hydrolase
MQSMQVHDVFLPPEPGRVVLRPFHIASEPRDLHPLQHSRMHRIIDGVTSMGEEACAELLRQVGLDFNSRHQSTEAAFMRRFDEIGHIVSLSEPLSAQQKMLIGAYFCHEYSFAAAAVMNPSIVLHPRQGDLSPGTIRFVLSLRTVGEGHISSITFREGELTADHRLTLYPHSGPTFAVDADEIRPNETVTATRHERVPISGAVIFPFTPAQRNGLEDLRLVDFRDGESRTYYGTYTAYSGKDIRSELMSTKDFKTFHLMPLKGTAAVNKGMALFPRKIGGAYAMMGRQDGESIYYMQSDDLLRWDGGARVAEPKYAWELVQIGNCGAPIEIDEGWLVLTHGVGAMRKYSIGAMLLDKHNPQRVLGRLAEPLLVPSEHQRDGYVPNVVYTCGALLHARKLLVPYGVADMSVSFASFELEEILNLMI